MNRRGFTLIELMVSIALTTIVVLFLYRALSNQERANGVLARKGLQLEERRKVYELLFRDLMEASSVKVVPLGNRNFTILQLKTTNSLHQVPKPYVAYFVHERNATLVRLESARPIGFPVPLGEIKYIFADPLVNGVEKFIIVERGAQGGRRMERELLPGEKALPQPPKGKGGRGREYLIYLKWKGEEFLIDMKKRLAGEGGRKVSGAQGNRKGGAKGSGKKGG
ncbi:MAG: prepilin-type N-terminal cleavage/methylation domain-containing protein [Epsilonproteobacteria bacterium]|nr:hypothetical protein [Campylobacterota bacterium]NPA57642.1 prepilin-type N-terminal cleavage/methylation domain-containing protein [Campylobacterota bacterium]